MIASLEPRLVTTIPAAPELGVLYVSVEYATTLHLCACGCGHEVVLGISPDDWTVCWDGRTVTLDPSVGNWSLPCQSHYFIRHNRVVRTARWDDEQITAGRARDAARKRPVRADAPSQAPSRAMGAEETEAAERGERRSRRWLLRLGRLVQR